MSAIGVAALIGPIAAGGAAGANDDRPRAVSVDITGGDHFIRPGLITNDFSFPLHPIVVGQGGKITFHNRTNDGHTVVLVDPSDVPTTTQQVFNCSLCDAVNMAFFPKGPGPGLPAGAQIDNGSIPDDETQLDADATDTGALQSAKTPLPPDFRVLIEDFDTVTKGKITDATLMDTSDPKNGNGGPTQRTIVVTAKPGLYNYICSIHPWMQGQIRVTASHNGGGERD
jgi:plastocyanin